MAAAWRIRGFELDRRLGAGASSEVWRARVVSSGDVVALKRLVLSDVEQGRRAVAEAAKLRVLDHPHLVRLHDVVLHRDAAVLVLDLADAGSLADLLTVRGRVTPGEAITAIAPVAAALAHVHAAGVVHGDVSPANVLFTRGGSPLLADLGVARLTGDEADAQSTPAYVDPIVARGGVPTSHTDVFMLGAVALHALTGAPLWTAPTGDAALAQAATGGLGHVDGRLAMADLPPGMSAVIRRALSLEPQGRGSAADFALDLRHSGEPVAVELAAGRTRVVGQDAEAPPAGPPRSATSRGVPADPVGATDPGSQSPVPPPATLTRPRRLPDRPSGGTAAPRAAVAPRATAVARATVAPGVVAAVSADAAAPPEIPTPGTPLPPVRAIPPAAVARSASAPRMGGGRHAAVPVARRRRDAAGPNPVDRVRRAIAGRGRAPSGEPGGDTRSLSLPAFGDPARPAFVRPTSTGPVASVPDLEVVVGRPAPTRAVARARPSLPTPRRRSSARAVATGAGIVVMLVTIVLAAVLIGRGHSPAVAAPAARSAPAATPDPDATASKWPAAPGAPTQGVAHSAPARRPARGTPVARSTPSPIRTQAGPRWPAALRRLDELRARAYATRNTALLRRVYVAGPLLASDARSLRRLAPPGCGLTGVHTDYRFLTTRDAGTTAVLSVRASLPRSRVICAGQVVRTAGAVAPTRLRITLVRRGATVLIAAEQVQR